MIAVNDTMQQKTEASKHTAQRRWKRTDSTRRKVRA